MKLKNILVFLKNGLLYILFGSFLSKAVALISSVVVARLVDKTEYAYLAYADNLYSYLTLFSGVGLASALLIHCTDNISTGKHRSYLKSALLVGGGFEALTSLLLCIAVQFADVPYIQARKYMWLLILYPILTYIFTCLQAYIRVLRNNKLYAQLGALNTIVVCALTICLVAFLSVYGVVAARYIAVLAVTLIASIYIKNHFSGIIPDVLDKAERKKFYSTGVSLMIANVFSGMMPINESFLVNHLIRDEVITANFKVAGIIPSLLPLITSAVMVYYFPIIASLTDFQKVKSKVHKIAFGNAVIIIAAVIFGMLLTPLTIKLVYGSKYMDAVSTAYLLWIMRAVNTVTRMVPLNMLAAIGETKYNAFISVLTSVFHIILDYIFISMWGIDGVAYAAIIVYLISAVFMWAHFNKACNKKSALQNTKETEG